MASRFSIQGTISMVDKASATMGNVAAKSASFSSKMQKRFMRADASANKLTGSIGNLVKGIIGANIIQGVIIKLKNLSVQAIKLGSDLIEVQNVVDVTFGKMSSKINTFADNALEKFGLSELQAKQFAGTFGAMIKSSGLSGQKLVELSTSLTGLTGDFASFYNLPHDVAFQKLRAGISGETEPLKQLGINMSVANLSAFALTKGITKSFKAMTQAEKTMLRYNFIMKASKDAQNDFSRTLDTSFANQYRVAQTRFNQVLAKTAVQILPLLTDMFKKLNQGIKKLDPVALGQGLKKVVEGVVSIGKAIIFISPLLINMGKLFIAYKVAVLTAAAAQKTFQAVSFVLYLIQMRAAILLAVKGHWLQTKALVAQKIAQLVSIALWIKQKALMIGSAIAQGILTVATWLYTTAVTAATVATAALGAVIGFLTSPITLTIAAISALIGITVLIIKNWSVVKEFMIEMWDGVKLAFGSAIDWISDKFNVFINFFTEKIAAVRDFFTSSNKISAVIDTRSQQIIKQTAGDVQGQRSLINSDALKSERGFASPQSQGITNTNNNNTTGSLDVNFNNAPAGTNVKQKGQMPPGMTLNTGVEGG